MGYLSWETRTRTCLPAIDINATNMSSPVGTQKKFAKIKTEMTQIRKRGSRENRDRPCVGRKTRIRNCGEAHNDGRRYR